MLGREVAYHAVQTAGRIQRSRARVPVPPVTPISLVPSPVLYFPLPPRMTHGGWEVRNWFPKEA